MKINIKKTNPKAIIPTRAHKGDIFDLYSCEDVILKPGKKVLIDTGIAFEFPEGYAGRMYSRSGLSFKKGIILLNSVGIIDGGYRGSIKVGLLNIGLENFAEPGSGLYIGDYEIKAGDRIAQLDIVKQEDVELNEIEEFETKTEREDGGFGSTGK